MGRPTYSSSSMCIDPGERSPTAVPLWISPPACRSMVAQRVWNPHQWMFITVKGLPRPLPLDRLKPVKGPGRPRRQGPIVEKA